MRMFTSGFFSIEEWNRRIFNCRASSFPVAGIICINPMAPAQLTASARYRLSSNTIANIRYASTSCASAYFSMSCS